MTRDDLLDDARDLLDYLDRLALTLDLDEGEHDALSEAHDAVTRLLGLEAWRHPLDEAATLYDVVYLLERHEALDAAASYLATLADACEAVA